MREGFITTLLSCGRSVATRILLEWRERCGLLRYTNASGTRHTMQSLESNEHYDIRSSFILKFKQTSLVYV
jgi:hypothetical protein